MNLQNHSILLKSLLGGLFAILFLFSGAAFLGCIGGGGGGGGGSLITTAADETEITTRVEAFMGALTQGNSRTLNELFSERMQSLTGLDQNVETFTFWDFGRSITDPSDNASYTFFCRFESDHLSWVDNRQSPFLDSIS